MFIKKGIIDRIEGSQAIISLEDGQFLNWEGNNLPSNLAEGDFVTIEIKNSKEASAQQQELAREILNEIFNNVPQATAKTEIS